MFRVYKVYNRVRIRFLRCCKNNDLEVLPEFVQSFYQVWSEINLGLDKTFTSIIFINIWDINQDLSSQSHLQLFFVQTVNESLVQVKY